MKSVCLGFCLVFLCIVSIRADLLLEMEGGLFSGQQSLMEEARAKGDKDRALYAESLGEFYRVRLTRANDLLASVPLGASHPAAWLKTYLASVLPLLDAMETSESEHFILKTPKRESFLSPYALEALEKQVQALERILGVKPEGKIQVEIYPTQENFTAASTLSKEILERSGAIGICKFRRLMILSPEQLAFGYRWLDTLAHEYTHYAVNVLSGGNCPLWLHEGIAKYQETRWRLEEPDYLTPGARSELEQARKDGKLVPFKRMEPSMVYLDNQDQVRLAFCEVAHAVHYIETLKPNGEGLRLILNEFKQGKTRAEAFQKILGRDSDRFESDWRTFLESEGLQISKGAMPDVKTLGRKDEVEELSGPGARAQIRLGDRMRLNGRADAALLLYAKAIQQEPSNPVALVKMARTLIALGRPEEAEPHLETSARENPNYAPAFLLLAERAFERKDWARAEFLYKEANAINPFNPEVHRRLSIIYQTLGRNELSLRESTAVSALEP